MNMQAATSFKQSHDDQSPRIYTKARFFCAQSSVEAFIRPLMREHNLPVHIKDNTPNGKVYTFTAFTGAEDIPHGFCVRISLGGDGAMTLTTATSSTKRSEIIITPESCNVLRNNFAERLEGDLQTLYPNMKHIIAHALWNSKMMERYRSIAPSSNPS